MNLLGFLQLLLGGLLLLFLLLAIDLRALELHLGVDDLLLTLLNAGF